MAAEAIDILKRFYARGNQNIPVEKRHRKGVLSTVVAAVTAVNADALPTRESQDPVLPSPSSTSSPDSKRAKV